MFEGFAAGGLPGGQLMTTTEVENFPGFSKGIQGPQLMKEMRQQALRWVTKLITDDVVKVDFGDRPFTITSDDLEVKAKAVIIATGATAKRLHIEGETQFWNNGISACAICDGTNPLFQNVEIAVVGGGDSAAEEALYLTKYASKVHLLVRSDRLRASKVMQELVLSHDKIQIHWQVLPISAQGDDVLQSIQIQDQKDHTIS